MGRNFTRICLLANPQQAEESKIHFFQGLSACAQGWAAPFSLGGDTCVKKGMLLLPGEQLKAFPAGKQAEDRQWNC